MAAPRPIEHVDDIVRALARRPQVTLPRPAHAGARASVAVIIAPADQLHLCFITRSTRADDHWSGQMAFPGGRAISPDEHPRAVAIREAREEVGLDLSDARSVGALPELPLSRHGSPTDGVVSPFVFVLRPARGATPALPPLVCEPAEVAAAHWIGLSYLQDRNNGTEFVYEYGGERRTFPAIRYGKQVIWGLTYRILLSLLDRSAEAG